MVSKISGIAIAGKMCVGKDLLGAFLVGIIPMIEYYGRHVKLMAYADRLKSLADDREIPGFIRDCHELGLTLDERERIESAIWTCKENYPITPSVKPREFLQVCGQVIRAIRPTIWIEHMDLAIARVTKETQEHGFKPPLFISTDNRLENEWRSRIQLGHCLIVIHTSDPIRHQRIQTLYGEHQLTSSVLNHPSEQGIDQIPDDSIDIVLQNDGTIAEFFVNIRNQIVEYVEKGGRAHGASDVFGCQPIAFTR